MIQRAKDLSRKNVLFVTWDGPQTSYLEGLFLPIFRGLAIKGWDCHVLQFTWGDPERVQLVKAACSQAGVPYHELRVWRKPATIGAVLTAVRGVRSIRRAIREWNIHVVMPRSILPVLSSMRALRGMQIPMVFDADGLPLDERVDFRGMSPKGLTYRFLRDVEAQGVRCADVVLTRTQKAADILLARAGAGVEAERFCQVGNGRDVDRFTPSGRDSREQVRKRLGIDADAPLLVYTGSLGGQYCLSEMLMLFSKAVQRRPDARFLILTGSLTEARSAVIQNAGLKDKIVIRSVSPNEVPEYLASSDLGLSLRRPSFSMQGVVPIKLGEYLLCGLPVVATPGVGDAVAISPEVGFPIDELDSVTLERAAAWFTDEVLVHRECFRSRCREAGLEYHSLESSIASYQRALERVGL
ncbi:MAG: glycosyltransferase [Pseudohongiellaceae bacterium]